MNCVGFWIIVTSRSNSSELSSPALVTSNQNGSSSRNSISNAPLVEVNVCLLADNVGIPSAHTLDFCESVHDLPLAIYVRVKQTQDVLYTISNWLW